MAANISTEHLYRLLELGKPVTAIDTLAASILGLGSFAYLAFGIPWDRPDPYHHVWFTKPQDAESKAEKVRYTRNIAQKMQETDSNLVICWGSQSGTAETLANKLARECQNRFGLSVLVADLSDFDAKTISEIPTSKMAIFMLSTFGEGDPSDNTAGLWTWIRDLSSDQLKDLRYFAFGLGNSTYKHYNGVVNVVTESFDRAGANRLMTVGRADDSNGGTVEDFLAWQDSLFAYFKSDPGFQEREVAYTPVFPSGVLIPFMYFVPPFATTSASVAHP
ncbi:Flavodoxin-like [Fusarium oxysporum f. sp. vasinfectum]|nr:Flavodoxin-like [Fusarium oxysporum f. sp. vasinfectum]